MHVYMRQVEIIKQIQNYTNNIKFKKNYNDDIFEYSRNLKVIKYDSVRNSSGRLFQYLGAVTVKAASTYIDETSGTESFISSHLRLRRVLESNRIRTVPKYGHSRYFRNHKSYKKMFY